MIEQKSELLNCTYHSNALGKDISGEYAVAPYGNNMRAVFFSPSMEKATMHFEIGVSPDKDELKAHAQNELHITFN